MVTVHVAGMSIPSPRADQSAAKCLPAKLEPLGGGECLVTVMEGKYHQVKRMLASRGKPVLELRRLAVGGLALDAASEPGQWRELGEDDLCSVFLGRKQ